MKLAWNAIVKNESAVIERCIKSLLPHIDCAIVVDTGSTDGTPELIQRLFDAAGKPVEIRPSPFKNFEQARNEALRCARLSRLEWDYLLLADADMELKVHKQGWLNGGNGVAYDIRQVSGSLGYYNRRLVSRHAQGWYVGVTHEYLDIASAGVIDGAEFVDHADGANRPDKFSRDIALLEEALKTETREGLIQRYHFYLAGSYFDAGNFGKALGHYTIRASLGGFDEEVWYAQMRVAQCFEKLGRPSDFVWELLRAYQLRPHRGEVLYELARFFRERGDNSASLLFSAPGMQLSHAKTDHLFVNDYVYRSGLKEEFAICAYYDQAKRKQGAVVCDELSLRGSQQASSNLYWYLEPLVNHVPSFRPTRIELPAPAGWVATNPSVINLNGRPTAIVRTVNYTITPEGQYAILGTDGTCNNGNPIRTRNYLVRFSRALKIESSFYLALPANWPEPQYSLVMGFEDSRLFNWEDKLWTLSTVRELTKEGWCEQMLAPIDESYGYGNRWKVIHPLLRQHEKNWMPWVHAKGRLDIVYRLGVVMNTDGKLVHEHPCELDVKNMSGSSQVIEAEGYNIALVHEARTIPGRPHNRFYQHRFVLLGDAGELLAISPAFFFHDRQIEFAAGLAYFPVTQKLIVSYGVRDCEAWFAEMDVFEVLDFIEKGRS